MKKILKISLGVVCATVSSLLLFACGGKGDEGGSAENPEQFMFYALDDGTYAVGAGGSKFLSDIVIPDEFNGKPVTGIADLGFVGGTMQSVTIPETVKRIGDSAFENCAALGEVKYADGSLDIVNFNGVPVEGVEGVEIGKNAFIGTAFPEINFADGVDGSFADVTVKNALGKFDRVEYDIALNDVTDVSATGAVPLAINGTADSSVDLKAYGRFKKAKIKLMNGSEKFMEFEPTNIAVTAEKYNFAPISASYPVLVFALKLKEITEDGTIPTFVALERYDHFDWDKLYSGATVIPTVARADAYKLANRESYVKMSEYIGELYELNPSSHFTLYCNDTMPELILQMCYANKIPETNFNAVLLSDGSGTATQIASAFGNIDDPYARLNSMVAEWNALKKDVYENGYDYKKMLEVDYPRLTDTDFWYAILWKYDYAIARDDNVEWWTNRIRANENLTAIKDKAFADELVTYRKEFYTNSLLAALTNDDQQKFKSLYKFDDGMFEEAETQSKKAMVILGTGWSTEKSTFYDYLKMTMDYYGDDYVYYYKGHPAYPTVNVPERQEIFDRLDSEGYNVIELESALAAEIILFFKPEVSICGWSSTTFQSVTDQEMACALFGSTKQNAATRFPTYYEKPDIFISTIKKGTTQFEYGGHTFNLDGERTYYLFEYNDTAEYQQQVDRYALHDIAIYDTSDGSFKYYKQGVQVNADGTPVTA